MLYQMFYFIGLAIVFLAIIFVFVCFTMLKKRDEGTEDMKDIAKIIRDGAFVFMEKEYKAISITVLVVAVLLTVFIEKTAGLTFIAGALASSCVCVFGMVTGTFGNVRTTNAAR